MNNVDTIRETMKTNPYELLSQRTLAERWGLGHSHATRGLRNNPPKYSGVNLQAVIAYSRGYDAGLAEG